MKQKIKYIQSVIESYGTLNIQELGEDDIVLYSENNLSQTITHINYDSVTTNEFIHEILVNENEISLYDLTEEIIDEIVFLVEIFETENLKTLKRIK